MDDEFLQPVHKPAASQTPIAIVLVGFAVSMPKPGMGTTGIVARNRHVKARAPHVIASDSPYGEERGNPVTPHEKWNAD